MLNALHSLVPNLRVSPLALSPRPLRFEVVLSMDDREVIVTQKRLLSFCLYDTQEKREAGPTLAGRLRGPKNGVHFRAL
jgi:hypothetical protein